MHYQYLKDKPTRFESLTRYTLEEFSVLLPYFIKHFLEYYATKTLDGNLVKNGDIPLTKRVVYQVLKISYCLF